MDVGKYGPWALIVGGSEGVGAGFARFLAADGYGIVLVARKQAPLDALAAELRAGGTAVRVVSVDLSRPDALARVRAVTDDLEVGLLVYNAGANATRGLFVELPEAVTDVVIAINVLGQVAFARHYGAAMIARGRGGMILTGSMGGYLGSPQLAAYTAAKSLCRIFAEALRAECAPYDVDVLHLIIGFTATPTMARLGLPVDLAEDPAKVAREGLDRLGRGEPLHLVSTPGNAERARKIAAYEDRGALVRAYAIVPREDTSEAAEAMRRDATPSFG